MSDHVHYEGKSCICYQLAEEPDEQCPVHGYPSYKKCSQCGQFMKRKLSWRDEYLNQYVTVPSP